MKVLSLLQPWATLVVIGAKKIETRSWNTKFSGPLLIHASKNFKIAMGIAETQPFKKHIKKWEELPYGAIIGSVNLIQTSATKNFVSISNDAIKTGWAAQIDWKQELAFGDYSEGRYGWLFKDPVQFKNPIPTNGSLSLWDAPFQICMQCGCTDIDCRHCIERTGMPCSWVKENLCSACYQQ